MRHRFSPRRLPRPSDVSLLGVSGVLLLVATFGGSAQGPLRRVLRPAAGPVAGTVPQGPAGDPVDLVSGEGLTLLGEAPGDGGGDGELRPPVVGATIEELTGTAARGASELEAEEALEALAPRITRSSHPEALRTAFEAYFRYREANPKRVRKPYLYFVDMGLDNRTPRGWVFDMESLEVVEGPFTVAHGRGSARQRDGVPTSFSNRPGSKASSLGLYLAQETYTFRGKSGGRAYSSVGLRLKGESGPFNDQARRRGIVAHGAPYVTRASAGRSEGCPAMEPARARRLLPLLADGGVVFLYSPRDEGWLDDDPWAGATHLAAEGAPAE